MVPTPSLALSLSYEMIRVHTWEPCLLASWPNVGRGIVSENCGGSDSDRPNFLDCAAAAALVLLSCYCEMDNRPSKSKQNSPWRRRFSDDEGQSPGSFSQFSTGAFGAARSDGS
jgi:hypothetical protein